jgi:hypothetical protein
MTVRLVLPLVLFALCAYGCAGQQKKLLEQDYLHMSNDELLTYHDNLSTQIARCDGGGDSASVGVGTGYGSGGVGVGVGLSHIISTCNPDKLKERRREVIEEMKRRGLAPPVKMD